MSIAPRANKKMAIPKKPRFFGAFCIMEGTIKPRAKEEKICSREQSFLKVKFKTMGKSRGPLPTPPTPLPVGGGHYPKLFLIHPHIPPPASLPAPLRPLFRGQREVLKAKAKTKGGARRMAFRGDVINPTPPACRSFSYPPLLKCALRLSSPGHHRWWRCGFRAALDRISSANIPRRPLAADLVTFWYKIFPETKSNHLETIKPIQIRENSGF